MFCAIADFLSRSELSAWIFFIFIVLAFFFPTIKSRASHILDKSCGRQGATLSATAWVSGARIQWVS